MDPNDSASPNRYGHSTILGSGKLVFGDRFGVEYKPLTSTELRLVRLHPGIDEEPLRGALQHYDHDDGVSYAVLSYAWKSNEEHEIIYINGCNFEIRGNLAKLLRSLRKPGKSILLWVDAICINRNDSKDRDPQIMSMHRIARQAAERIFWLIEDDEEDTALFHEIENACQKTRSLEGCVPCRQENIKCSFNSVAQAEFRNICDQCQMVGHVCELDIQALESLKAQKRRQQHCCAS